MYLEVVENSLDKLDGLFEETFKNPKSRCVRPDQIALDNFLICGDENGEGREEATLTTSRDKIRRHVKRMVPNDVIVPIVAMDAHTTKIATLIGEKSLIYACKVAVIKEKNGDFLGTSKTFLFKLDLDYDRMKWFYNEIVLQGILNQRKIERSPPQDPAKLADRVRNAIERYTQLSCVSPLKNAMVIFDGALVNQRIDLPRGVLPNIISMAQHQKTSILAIAKSSKLTTRDGQLIQNLLTGINGCCYIDAQKYIDATKKYLKRLCGRIHIVKFSDLPIAPSFRVDVSPSQGQTYDDVFSTLISSASFRMVKTYPEVLFLAHIYSKLTYMDYIDLLCGLASKYDFMMEPTIDLREAILEL